MTMRWMLFLVCIWTCGSVWGQDSVYRFRNFGPREGLPEKYVYSVATDRFGFLWFGTATGLYRFDGRQFELRRSTVDQSGFSIGNILQSVYTDRKGVLWLGSINALQWMDPATGVFTAPQASGPANRLRAAFPLHFAEDNQERVWMATANRGLCHFNRLDSSFHEHASWFSTMDSGTVLQVHPRLDGTLLVLRAHGIYQVDPSKGVVKRYPAPKTELTSLYHDTSRGCWWVTTLDRGLLQFFPETGEYRDLPAINVELARHNLFSVARRPDGLLWVGSYPLFLVNPELGTQRVFTATAGNPFGLQASRIVQLHTDGELNLWMMSHAGLSMLTANQGLVRKYRLLNTYSGQPMEPTMALEIPSNGQLLLAGTNSAGLIRYDPASGRQVPISHPLVPSKAIPILFSDADGTIWASDDERVFRYVVATDRLVHQNVRDDQGRLPGLLGRSCFDRSGTLYIAAPGRGYFTWQRGQSIMQLHPLSSVHPSLVQEPDGRLLPSVCDRRGWIWFTAKQGVWKLDPNTGKFESFLVTPQGKIPALVEAHSMVEDQRGHIWITSRANGLFEIVVTPNGPSFRHYDRNSGVGLPVDYLSRIRADAMDRSLWINSLAGLIRFDPIQQQVITVMNEWYGLESTDAYTFFQSSNGDLFSFFFGLFNQIPANRSANQQRMPLRWTQVSRMGAVESWKHFPDTMSIQLEPDQPLWAVQFSLLGFGFSDRHRYQSWLEGLETDWTNLDNTPELRYSGLKPGNYRLRVRAFNATGVPASNELLLLIEVKRPIWQQGWFVGLVTLLVVGLIAVFYRIRIQRVRHESSLKAEFEKAKADMEMRALRAQMNPHFIFNSLNSIQNYILRKSPQEAAAYLTRFSRLIRLILDHSDQAYVYLSSELEGLKLYLQMEQLRFDEAFEVHWNIAADVHPDTIQVPTMLIQPYLENAIWHGLLHRSGPGRLEVEISRDTPGDEARLQVIIRDNGIGRAASQERQLKQQHKRLSRGMHITAERIRLINAVNTTPARVDVLDLVDSNGVAAGTAVHLWLPIFNPHQPSADA